VDGPGFKLRRTAGGNGTMPDGDDVVSGKTYGPYVDSKFSAIGFALRDGNQNTILYYTATGRKPNLTVVAGAPADGPYVGTNGNAFYNASQNSDQVLPVEDMRKLLGDENANGAIQGTETAAHTGPFLLWAAGNDGVYGLSNEKSDDITNFTLPQRYVK
jgi:hypothetical protein